MAEPLRREPGDEERTELDAELEGDQRPGRRHLGTAVQERPEGRGWTWGSFALALLGIFFTPLIGGALGMLVGWVGYRRGDALARWAIVTNAAVFVLGIIYAIVILVR